MKKYIMLTVMAIVALMGARAQSYYDDDIYYDAKKAQKERAERQVRANREAAARQDAAAGYERQAAGAAVTFAGSDTQLFDTGNTRDVDEYNRRTAATAQRVPTKQSPDSISLDQLLAGDFAYTRQIEKFSNPSIVSGSEDPDLQELYYATTATEPATSSTINVYNIDAWPTYSYLWPGYNPWYYNYYSYHYNPWYYGAWGPTWGWSWGYDPWWGWNCGPSWSWTWGCTGHHHHHGWNPGWNNSWHHTASRPVSPGATRPARPGSNTVSTPGYRPGSTSAGYRPGAATAGYRPGSTTAGYRPGTTPSYNGTGSAAGAGRRPSQVNSPATRPSSSQGATSTGRTGRSGSSYNSSSSSSNHGSSWNSSSSSSSSSSSGYRSSGSSYSSGGSGRSSGGYSGGGRSSGGGGGGRSGRR